MFFHSQIHIYVYNNREWYVSLEIGKSLNPHHQSYINKGLSLRKKWSLTIMMTLSIQRKKNWTSPNFFYFSLRQILTWASECHFRHPYRLQNWWILSNFSQLQILVKVKILYKEFWRGKKSYFTFTRYISFCYRARRKMIDDIWTWIFWFLNLFHRKNIKIFSPT